MGEFKILSYRNLMIVFFIGLSANPLHEFGHWFWYAVQGIKAGISFNHTYYIEEMSYSFMGALGGPLLSLILSILGLIIMIKSDRFQLIGSVISIIFALTRLLPYISIFYFGIFQWNDEGIISLYLGFPVSSMYYLFGVTFIIILILNWKYLRLNIRNKLFVLGIAFIVYLLALAIEIGMLENFLFNGVEIRELVKYPK